MKWGSALLLLLALVGIDPSSALACACCAEPGTWFQRTDKPDAHRASELERLRFSSKATLYLTLAGAETVKGIGLPDEAIGELFTVSLTREKKKWTFVFKDHKGERGALVFTEPEKWTFYGVDLREQSGEGLGPSLYKEWRLEGHVWGNGFFKPGVTSDLKFRLVLQGRGNMCDAADDFKHWRLQVWGPKADYTFLGGLEAAAGGG